MYDECRKHMNYHVVLTMTDGSTIDGIIENVDMDSITVLAGEDVMEREIENESDIRQYYGGFGRPRRRFRRFRRRNFPLATLAALALLPYIAPSPYPYYPYPYPYY
nr:small nuclear ribonucleoprotein [Virgibacillus natechei]